VGLDASRQRVNDEFSTTISKSPAGRQAPNHKQITNSNFKNIERFGFGIWSLFGAWSLELGISAAELR
jgi:hypothetical protein